MLLLSLTMQCRPGLSCSERYARRLLNELTELNFPAVLTEGDGLFRVTVGEYDTLDEAVKMERRLKRAGYQTVIVTV